MIDIHMHLVPGMDDGAEDIEMALVMMVRAQQQGISHIIVTPHSEAFHFFKEDGRVIFKRLAAVASKVCPDVSLYIQLLGRMHKSSFLYNQGKTA